MDESWKLRVCWLGVCEDLRRALLYVKNDFGNGERLVVGEQWFGQELAWIKASTKRLSIGGLILMVSVVEVKSAGLIV